MGDKVAAITESAMRGEIGFRESFHQRIALLKGMPETVLSGIADNLPITEGGKALPSLFAPPSFSRLCRSLTCLALGYARDGGRGKKGDQ